MYIEKLIEKFGPPPSWTPDTQGTKMNQVEVFIPAPKGATVTRRDSVCVTFSEPDDTLVERMVMSMDGHEIQVLYDRPCDFLVVIVDGERSRRTNMDEWMAYCEGSE